MSAYEYGLVDEANPFYRPGHFTAEHYERACDDALGKTPLSQQTNNATERLALTVADVGLMIADAINRQTVAIENHQESVQVPLNAIAYHLSNLKQRNQP